MKKKAKLILKTIAKKVLPFKLLINNRYFSRLIEMYSPEELNRNSRNIFSFYVRDKYNFIKSKNHINSFICEQNIGILIQGPLKREDEFTYYTILNYVKILPPNRIVLSTWKDEDINYIDKIRQLGVNVILNDRPKNSGFGNINYQIKNTISGLTFLKNVGVKYVAKTRTDTRIEKSNAFIYLVCLLKNFKLENEINNQNNRIVLIDFNTRMKRPYNMSDIFQFGHIDDLINIWNIEEDKRENTFSNDIVYSDEQLFNLEIAENYIMKKFINKIGIPYEYNIEEYYKLLAKRFIIIDSIQIGHYWYKYFNLEQPLPFQKNACGSFADWLILYEKYN